MLKHAVILAAGRGMRMMPLTAELPKPMLEVNGVSLIARSIVQLKEQVPHIYITVGYKGASLAKHVIEQGVSAVINTDGQENGWWVFNSLLQYLDAPLLVLTCDNIVTLDLDFIDTFYTQYGEPACMVVPVKPVPEIEGDYIIGENGLVKKLDRHSPTPLYCSGIQVLNPAKVNRLVKGVTGFYGIWQSLIAQQALYYSDCYPGAWFSVDTPEQLMRASNG